MPSEEIVALTGLTGLLSNCTFPFKSGKSKRAERTKPD